MDNEVKDKEEKIIDKEKNPYGGYVSKIVLNDDVGISINESDIVVFVGPNNAGKSQSLKDIYGLCESKNPSIVIKDIEIVKRSYDISELLNSISTVYDHGSYKDYSGLGFNFNSYSLSEYNSNKYYGNIRSLFVTYMDTLQRLTISNPANLITRKDAKNNPIHYAAFDRNYREWLSDNFKKAFGKELIPHTLNGGNIPLCIGDAVKFEDEFADNPHTAGQ